MKLFANIDPDKKSNILKLVAVGEGFQSAQSSYVKIKSK